MKIVRRSKSVEPKSEFIQNPTKLETIKIPAVFKLIRPEFLDQMITVQKIVLLFDKYEKNLLKFVSILSLNLLGF